MKRDLLAKSLAQMSAKPAEPPEAAPRSLRSMSEVLSQVSAQAAQEIDVSEIADSEIADRFDVTEGLEELIESIRTSGQQLPALLRYRRGPGPRYEVVYGRRRIAACRALGLKVKAYVKEMDQREALVSQALENSARLERSFIEQAIFATKLEDQGFTRAEIGDVLAVDKGTLSKLIGVARDIPADVIYQIGAAHDAGRRPWLELRRLVKLEAAPAGADLLALVPDEDSAAERLNHLVGRLQKIETRKLVPPPARSPESGPVAAKARGQRLLIQVADKDSRGFLTYLEGRIAELYDTWKRS